MFLVHPALHSLLGLFLSSKRKIGDNPESYPLWLAKAYLQSFEHIEPATGLLASQRSPSRRVDTIPDRLDQWQLRLIGNR
jgi:hypothetical protein